MNNFDFLKQIKLGGEKYQVVDFHKLEEIEKIKIKNLPFSARVILENLIRNLNTSYVDLDHIKAFKSFYTGQKNLNTLIPFFPSRVLMQDFTGVPAVVDLAAMRDAVKEAGFDPEEINPSIPVDLVIDHSIAVDHCKSDKAPKLNVEKEYQRNKERYSLLKWAAKSFKNFRVVPPGSGICHQVNLEYLAKVVCTKKDDILTAFPDTVIGTDSHTTMINGLGVLGWGVGGIEAEAVMLGEPYYMNLPEIIGVKLIGEPSKQITTTDIVLMITQKLRAENVVEKIVEFTGPGVNKLSLTDRATIANMAPEYGATAGFFPIDSETISYLNKTNRNKLGNLVETYCKECSLFATADDSVKFNKIIEIDLSTIELSIAGPSKPNQRILLKDVKKRSAEDNNFTNETILIAALSSCTNTSNPNVMIGAGLVAKKAVEKGLEVPWFVKTSLSPGSKVVIDYLEDANLMKSLNQLGFNNTGFGCMTCIGNSGQLEPKVEEKIIKENLNTMSVLSGNRNFEARIHQDVIGNFLMSPILVVIYAIAGRIDIDFKSEPLGFSKDGGPVFMEDIWPEADEINHFIETYVQEKFFKDQYADIFKGDKLWQGLEADEGTTFKFNEDSTYIRKPPFFKDFSLDLPDFEDIKGAKTLLVLGDSVTTDHISPAGAIPVDYPAGKYLIENDVKPWEFNSYGSRRGNHEVMMRGTFANIRIKNKLVSDTGGFTLKFPEK
ncbi:MAG: aconitate hydratase AcnA, partial [Desulfobacteraceae bacterium]|nr:aconitate hydratase AcnA [Desulfobacteraceae bacterium]